MPNYPYDEIGTQLDREFVAGLNKNFDEVEQDLRAVTEPLDAVLDGQFDSAALATNFEERAQAKLQEIQPEFYEFQTETTAQFAHYVDVKTLGAIGDGQYHPLSEKFSTLEDAILKYPAAQALSDSIDGCAIQLGLDMVEEKRGGVSAPDGNYVLSRSLEVPNYVTIYGNSQGGTILNNQYNTLDQPMIINKNKTSLENVTIKNLTIRGGTYGIKIDITEGIQNLNLENVSIEIQSVGGILANKLLQVSNFRNVIFYYCKTGITVPNWTTNHINFDNVEFLGLTGKSIEMNHAEVINFNGCRFEAEGLLDGTTIDLINAKNVKFSGCYFEGTHRNLINELLSNDSIKFENCHFTGASDENGGFVEYLFNSDGIIQFGTNTFHTTSPGSKKMLLTGINKGLGKNNSVYTEKNTQSVKFTSTKYAYSSLNKLDLLKFTRTVWDASPENAQILTGDLTMHAIVILTNGFSIVFSRKYLIKATSIGIQPIKINSTLQSSLDEPRTADLTVTEKTGSTTNASVLEAVFTGINYAEVAASSVQWSFDGIIATTNYENLVVDLA